MSFQRYPRRIREKKHDQSFFRIGLFLFGLFLIILSLNLYSPSIVPKEFRMMSLSKKQNILLLGCDDVFSETTEKGNKIWKGRSDTILVLCCNPIKNSFNILSVPRDTKIRVPRFGLQKMNFLNSIAGPVFTRRALEKMLKIKIDNYVVINVKSLNEIIDEVGGIEIDVPQKMQYRDYSAMLNIDLNPGKQILNGEQAIGFVRFRHDVLGDIGRIQRQQAFIRAAISKLWDPLTFTKIPQLTSIYKKTVLTDMKTKDIIRIANFIRNVSRSKQNIAMLPGEFGSEDGVSYWVADQIETRRIVKRLFFGEEIPDKQIKVNRKNVKISIYNGSQKEKFLATKLSAKLRKLEYSITYIQDNKVFVKTSKIYAQKANFETALRIKKDLDNKGEIIVGNFGPPDSDVTILAGDDLISVVSEEGQIKE